MSEREFISKKTQNEFREFLVGWSLREIENEFSAAGLEPDRNYSPQLGGQRREFVEQYYHALDLHRPSDVRKLLNVYENILISANQKIHIQYDKQATQRAIDVIVACLKNDGFTIQDSRIRPATLETRLLFDGDVLENSITELTRQNIFDAIQVARIAWSGRLTEPDFLSRLYDLDQMPSLDSRFKTAAGDIYQHREANVDWSDDWVLTDSRFDLKHASDEAFLRFLCEVLHPVIRVNNDEVQRLLALLNQCLAADGWELVVKTHLSGRPIFAGRRLMLQGVPAIAGAKTLAHELNAEYVTQQITRMEAAIEADTDLAIGTAKEFIETVCKTILVDAGIVILPTDDIPKLVKKVRDLLDLVPDRVPEKAKGAEIIKRMMSSLSSVIQGVDELRGLYGSGHGKHAKTKGLQSRHARFVVGAASTLGVFLFETYQERKVRQTSGVATIVKQGA